ncbi:hypothetical protein [Solirubrobacter soli]|uniref:hypothetical protein n=1 Tax=Solirubrobacter soli TaxID=363832 RepID=UPI00040E3E20|nr:hypothetical protein [Solirubrobacter soli]
MPTTRPRYTITDAGEITAMLDVAQRRWPDVTDRKELLVRLAAIGLDAIASEVDAHAREERRRRQLDAMRRAAELVDVDALLADTAWQ